MRELYCKKSILYKVCKQKTIRKECLTPRRWGHSRTVCARGGPWWSSGWGNWRSLPQTCNSSCPACSQISKRPLSAGPGVGRVGWRVQEGDRELLTGFHRTFRRTLTRVLRWELIGNGIIPDNVLLFDAVLRWLLSFKSKLMRKMFDGNKFAEWTFQS